MKKLMSVIMLCTSFSSFGSYYMELMSCSGKYSNGADVNVDLMVDEKFLCGDKGKSLLLVNTVVAPKSAFEVEFSTDEMGNTLAQYQIKEVIDGVESIYSAGLRFNDTDMKKAVYFEKVSPIEIDDDSNEEVELTCRTINYNMDC